MTEPVVKSYADIGGWFFWHDRALFDVLLDAQQEHGMLVELGAYLGRSAVIIGDHIKPGERFVVIDLFGDETALSTGQHDQANRAENRYSYATLTRQRFDANYLALHESLPEVVAAPSSVVREHVEDGSARFVHIDASHLYSQVAEDVRNARVILQPNGIVVFDDYSNPNTPGVAAAVWEAVITGGLVPFAVTPHKMYGTWGDPSAHLAAIRSFVAREERIGVSEQVVLATTVLRLKPKTREKAPATAAPAMSSTNRAAPPARRPGFRRSDWVPPVVARWARSRRQAARS